MDARGCTRIGSRLLTVVCAYALAGCGEAPSIALTDAAPRDVDVDVGAQLDASARLDGRGPIDAMRAAESDSSPIASASDSGGHGVARIAIFSRTAGYRHASIEVGREALRKQLPAAEFELHATEQGDELIELLPRSDVLLFLSTTGDVLSADQQARVEAFVREGGGFVGVHAASDTEYDWPFYGELIGAWFDSHPSIQDARVVVEAGEHPVVAGLPREWQRKDEWYNFRTNPRDRVTVLLRLDESSYTGGTMGDDHPIAWARELDRGRSVYTGLGHTEESWAEAPFLRHLENALRWAAGRD